MLTTFQLIYMDCNVDKYYLLVLIFFNYMLIFDTPVLIMAKVCYIHIH